MRNVVTRRGYGSQMRNIRLDCEYDGTNYHGFQRQAGDLPTIQGELEEKLRLLTGEDVKVTGSGRTDAGVHALKQVVNFRTYSTIPAERFAPALNSVLPPDIVITSSEEVPLTFHARFDVKSKTYRYYILNRVVPSAFWRKYAYHVPFALGLEGMNRAAQYLIGRHDFSSFSAANSGRKNFTREVMYLVCQREENDIVSVTIKADGFLYNMVRSIVGTLLEVGKGKLKPEAIQEILKGRNRELAGPTVPAQGLVLVDVEY